MEFLTCGVPQVSVPGPLLLLVHKKDLSLVCQKQNQFYTRMMHRYFFKQSQNFYFRKTINLKKSSRMSFGKNLEMINSFSGTFRSNDQAYIYTCEAMCYSTNFLFFHIETQILLRLLLRRLSCNYCCDLKQQYLLRRICCIEMAIRYFDILLHL